MKKGKAKEKVLFKYTELQVPKEEYDNYEKMDKEVQKEFIREKVKENKSIEVNSLIEEYDSAKERYKENLSQLEGNHQSQFKLIYELEQIHKLLYIIVKNNIL